MPLANIERALKKVQCCSRSRKTKILTIGIHVVFRGLKFESDTEIGQKGTFFKALIEIRYRSINLIMPVFKPMESIIHFDLLST